MAGCGKDKKLNNSARVSARRKYSKEYRDCMYARLHRQMWLELHPNYYQEWLSRHPYYFRVYCKKWRDAHPEYAKGYSREWRRRHTGYYRRYRTKNAKRLRGIINGG